MFNSARTLAGAALGALALGLAAVPTQAHAESPGLDAIDDFRSGKSSRPAVENRFFLKEGRFEISPMIGYVPNNPFARRYVGGAVVGYHFSEAISLQANISYSPDLGENDLKGLTAVLLDRAYNASATGGSDFQQPLDKVQLSGLFGIAWAPLYGKINLVGETVLNFDFYGFAGVGMVTKHNYIATYDENGNLETGDIVLLTPQQNEAKVAPSLGVGLNFFLNQMMAFKIDLRSAFYIDNKPVYEQGAAPDGQRLYNNFAASGGMAFFFPKMKPRLYNF
jgi:outer membrane beta-barrel protein